MLFGIILTLLTPAGALFEELLFGGIIQNVLNFYLPQPWLAIGITTVLFVGMHVQ
ncbi:type II CAAX prenyl endopeptidase Rce1 family protein [Paenibacillus rhizoplanae]|uniref:Type II CAAX prenyl endopeptidase Rce1 family protein n=1 Tax=Paenibacillus rhizoplanae TaxID=1917181 RepID=A0ABW5FFA2_9BACL